MAIKVTLRKKDIKGSRQSLYLDFYPAVPHPKTGKETRREFLKMYIEKSPKNPIQRRSNKETLWIAEQIRQKRESFFNKPEVYTEEEREKLRLKEIGKESFNEFFEQLANKRTGSNRSNWHSALKYLNAFRELRFMDISEQLANEFREYLLNSGLHQNTALSYFNKFKAALREAYKAEKLQKDINAKIKAIPEAETHRNFLTVDELNKLIETPCKDNILKRASLFSALTGLRFVDIKNLLREQLETFQDGYYLKFTQQKTKGTEYHPIPEQALSFMDKEGWEAFTGLRYASYHSGHLKKWIEDAGINKDITFHCFRHTFAVLQLANGTDIYTVSKLMGHRDLKTTQRYAKIVDSMKREAMNRIKLNL
ncbi:MAG: site-specific integrase [Bacteroidales bacterium]|nr:site-specific integrase [Bacteroidales bacterium]MCF8337181.1 site-specific integrase [Bacteroidales bacterium]